MIHFTENDTTHQLGHAIATVIADTVSPEGNRITTFELVYPRYIHSEVMTHRVMSRNASSSRATPLRVTLDEVRHDPVFFDYVGVNRSGMVAGAPLEDSDLLEFQQEWGALGLYVARQVEDWSERFGIHKQTLNRALEPWLRIRTLVTATDWENWYFLRCAEDAQPEIRSLANAMQCAVAASEPREDEFHTPYVDDRTNGTCSETDIERCVAACARVSYARHDGKPSDLEADRVLFARLLGSGHFSPFEHCAIANSGRHANYWGWMSYRKKLGK